MKIIKYLPFHSLAQRLAISIIVVVGLLLSAILYYNYQTSKQLILHQALDNAKETSHALVYKIDGFLQKIEQLSHNFGPLIQSDKHRDNEILLQQILRNNDDIFGTSFAQERENSAPYYYRQAHQIKFKNLVSQNYNYKEQFWYKNALQETQGIWSPPYFDDGGGNALMTTYSLPIYSKTTKELEGVFTLDISLEWLQKLLASVKIYKTGFAFLVDQHGRFIAHPNKEFINQKTLQDLAKSLKQDYLTEIAHDIALKKEGHRRVEPISIHKTSWMFYSPLSTNGWSLLIVFPEDELFTDLTTLNNKLGLIGIIGILLLLPIIFTTSFYLTSSLKKLSKLAKKIGEGEFDTQVHFDTSISEVELLGNSLLSMQEEIKKHIEQVLQLNTQKNKIEHELKIAHDIQTGIVPKIFPAFPTETSFDVHALVRPAQEVGGDLYDFYLSNDQKFYFVIGDVSGKGVPASLYMAITISLFRAFKHHTPAQILKLMNEQLCENNPNMMFVTLFTGVLDLKTGKVTYSNAGHNPPYVVSNSGNIRQLTGLHGSPLGVISQEYKEEHIQININDTLVLYTDGVTEAHNMNNELYGEERLKKLLEQSSQLSPLKISTLITEDIENFGQSKNQFDDITLQIIQFYGDNISKMEDSVISLSPNLEQLSTISTHIEDLENRNIINSKIAHQANLIIEEIFVNIVHHNKQADRVEITFHPTRDGINIVLQDNGSPFDPTRSKEAIDLAQMIDRDPGGLGIHLVEQIAHDINYKRIGNRNNLTLTLIKG